MYEKYFNSDLRKKYLLLNGLDLFSFKIPKSGKIEQVDNYSIFRGRAILELAMKYIQKTKIRDLSGYLKEEFIKKAEEELKVKYPLISFLYENIERSGDYAFSDYKTSEMSGKEFIKNELIKMIDLELSKIKK